MNRMWHQRCQKTKSSKRRQVGIRIQWEMLLGNFCLWFLFVWRVCVCLCSQVKAATGEEVSAEDLGGADLHCKYERQYSSALHGWIFDRMFASLEKPKTPVILLFLRSLKSLRDAWTSLEKSRLLELLFQTTDRSLLVLWGGWSACDTKITVQLFSNHVHLHRRSNPCPSWRVCACVFLHFTINQNMVEITFFTGSSAESRLQGQRFQSCEMCRVIHYKWSSEWCYRDAPSSKSHPAGVWERPCLVEITSAFIQMPFIPWETEFWDTLSHPPLSCHARRCHGVHWNGFWRTGIKLNQMSKFAGSELSLFIVCSSLFHKCHAAAFGRELIHDARVENMEIMFDSHWWNACSYHCFFFLFYYF